MSANATRSPGPEQTTRSVSEQFTELSEAKEKAHDVRRLKMAYMRRSQSRCTSGGGSNSVLRRDIFKIIESLLQDALKELDSWEMNLAEKTTFDVLETCVLHPNIVFIEDALRSVLHSLLLSVSKDHSKMRKSIEAVLVQAASSKKEMSQIAVSLAFRPTKLCPVAKAACGCGKIGSSYFGKTICYYGSTVVPTITV